MLQQKVSEPTRNSLWKDQDEEALGQVPFSSTDLAPLSKQLSSSFPILFYIQALYSFIHVPFVPQFPSCRGKCPPFSIAQPPQGAEDSMCQCA